jgi:hypothetical protein
MTTGKSLMLFVGGKSIAFATSHTFSPSATVTETSQVTKDTIGNAATNIVTGYSWTISSDNVMAWDGDTQNTNTPAGNTYEDLLNLLIAGTKVDVVFALGTSFNTSSGWTPAGTQVSGSGYVTDASVTADVSDNATFSVTITGTGGLTVTPAE